MTALATFGVVFSALATGAILPVMLIVAYGPNLWPLATMMLAAGSVGAWGATYLLDEEGS